MSKQEREMGEAITDLILATRRYMRAYKRRFEDSPVGNDYVIGPYVADILRGTHGLLDGPTGTLDCGATSSAIHSLARENELLDANGEIQND